MLVLAKLQWDVSGVTAFDFVDQLMERLPLCKLGKMTSPPVTSSPLADVTKPCSSTAHNNTLVRGHALTYVSLCCTGNNRYLIIFKLIID